MTAQQQQDSRIATRKTVGLSVNAWHTQQQQQQYQHRQHHQIGHLTDTGLTEQASKQVSAQYAVRKHSKYVSPFTSNSFKLQSTRTNRLLYTPLYMELHVALYMSIRIYKFRVKILTIGCVEVNFSRSRDLSCCLDLISFYLKS